MLTPRSPTKGSAVIFSSGWENLHQVEPLRSGVRLAIPAFFTTCPVPEQAYQQMHVGKPSSDEQIADDWLHLLLAHRAESPVESVGRVKELLMKWHHRRRRTQTSYGRALILRLPQRTFRPSSMGVTRGFSRLVPGDWR